MSDYELRGVPATQVDMVWTPVKHFIQAALDRTEGEMSIDDVYNALIERDMQLWILLDGLHVIGALVTQLLEFPNVKSCRYVAMGGDVHGDFEEITSMIEQWAATQGCQRMEIVGRPGWARALRDFGYHQAYSYVTKRIEVE
jgi:hypothetical protein